MANYEVFVKEELSERIKAVAAICNTEPNELIIDVVDKHMEEYLVSFIIKQFKEGKLKAREAWKASGLSYTDFQSRSQS